MTYRRDIEGLRALAVIAVLLYHAGVPGLGGGFVGVDVFFVISGFVITGLLWHEIESSGHIDFREFYTRRIRRILPPFAAVTLTSLALAVPLLSPTGSQQEAARTLRAGSLLGANAYLYRFGRDYFNPNAVNPFAHTWSLSVEEQIYLFLPVVLVTLAAIRIAARRRMVVGGLSLLAACSLPLSIAVSHLGLGSIPLADEFAYYLPFTRIWEFVAGSLLALTIHNVGMPSVQVSRLLFAVGAIAVGAAAFVFDESIQYPGAFALLPVLGTCVLIVAGSAGARKNRVTESRALVFVGDVSYEWYLWHWPAIVFAAVLWPGSRLVAVLAALISFPLAILTKKCVSDPIRYSPRFRGRRAKYLAVASLALPLGASTAVLAAADRAWWNDELREVVDAQQRSRSEAENCDSILRTEGCLFDAGHDRLVVLVGDSHAAVLSDLVWSIADELEANFGVWTRPSCPFLLDARQPICAEWSTKAAEWIGTLRPDVLVVHNFAGYPELDEPDAYIASLERTLVAAATDASRVIVIEDIPSFETSDITRASLLNPTPQVQQRQITDVIGDALALRVAMARAASSLIEFVETIEALCSGDVCTQRAGYWLYRDNDHLTRRGAELLRDVVGPAIERVLRT